MTWASERQSATTPTYLPKIVLCVPGNWASQEAVAKFLESSEVEFEFRGPDSRMASAFRHCGNRWRSSLMDNDFEAIEGHSSVLYALSSNFSAEEAAPCSHHFMRIGQRLLEMGGLAIKCESSGKAHSAKRWKELACDADAGYGAASRAGANEDEKAEGRMRFWQALYEAYVVFPIADDQNLYSCGLHLLGMPDLIVSNEVLERTFAGNLNERAIEAVRLFHAFALYLLAECPEGSFRSGNTFRCDATSPRFRVMNESCTGYDEDDFFFNPFGRWRFEEVSTRTESGT